MSAEFCHALINRPPAVGTAPPGVRHLAPRPGPAGPLHAWVRHGLAVDAHPLHAVDPGFAGYRALVRDPEGFCARRRAALATAGRAPD